MPQFGRCWFGPSSSTTWTTLSSRLLPFLLIFSTQILASRHTRELAAFDLLRLERRLDLAGPAMKDQPDVEEELNHGEEEERGCREKCNEQLRMGLDMVKAHSAFGSIGVPSVLEPLDLQLFCRFDAAHDQCLIGCGYQVQFNMRDFVCKRRREELVSYLNCFSSSAPQLKRQCGTARCGPYTELEMSLVGIGLRCRTLLCDLDCTAQVLAGELQCRERGWPAAQYLHAYSKLQVFSWLRQLIGAQADWQQWPRSCARLICGSGPRGVDGANCSVPEMLP